MRMLYIILASSALIACASSGPDRSAPGMTTATAVGDPSMTVAATELQPEDPGYWDEMICKREPVTGTRLTRARCHSRYDWARMEGAATETMRDIFSQPIACLEGDQCRD